jgi:hypothetical protein
MCVSLLLGLGILSPYGHNCRRLQKVKKDTKLIVVMRDRGGGQLVKQERDFLAELERPHWQHKSMMGESASF